MGTYGNCFLGSLAQFRKLFTVNIEFCKEKDSDTPKKSFISNLRLLDKMYGVS